MKISKNGNSVPVPTQEEFHNNSYSIFKKIKTPNTNQYDNPTAKFGYIK